MSSIGSTKELGGGDHAARPTVSRQTPLLNRDYLRDLTKRLQRVRRRASTALHVAGLRWARPFGFCIPYRYASKVRGAGEGGALEWLEQRMERESHEYLKLVREAAQFNDRFEQFHRSDPNNPNRPRFDQQWFAGIDAALAYALVRLERPTLIVEVGSGHSTRFLRQAITDSGFDTRLHSIDPKPRRDIDTICDEITRSTVESVSLEVFADLGRGDILFIDASHIAMPGTDVDYLFTRVLPTLQTGVRVHVHDVFLPCDYPEAWSGRGYNEQLIVAALLAGGTRLKILSPNAWLRHRRANELDVLSVPLEPGAYEASLWLEVTS